LGMLSLLCVLHSEELFVVSHDWHSGIVVDRKAIERAVPAAALIKRGYIEIGWGDERFYRSADPGILTGIRAALWPTESVLHLVWFDLLPSDYFPSSEVIRLEMDSGQFAALSEFIAASFAVDGNGKENNMGAGLYGESRFFQAVGDFHLFYNCNSWTADALIAAGCLETNETVLRTEDLTRLLNP